MKWRVGRSVPLNVYCDDRPVCQCHTPEDAAAIVTAMNWFNESVPNATWDEPGHLQVGISIHLRSNVDGEVECIFHNHFSRSSNATTLEPAYVPQRLFQYAKNALLSAVAEKLFPNASKDAAEMEKAQQWARARRDVAKTISAAWEE